MDSNNQNWQRKNPLRRWLDLSSILIALLWGGLALLLWPDVPKNSDSNYRYKSMIVADDRKLPDSEFYRRPDIIALPSAFSFEPQKEVDTAVAVLQEKKDTSFIPLERDNGSASELDGVDNIALAAEAVTQLRDGDGLAYMTDSDQHHKISEAPVFVSVSKKMGKNVELKWSKTDYGALFGGKSPWEAELSLRLDANGYPADVFLERSSGCKKLDRELVRILSRPDVWYNSTSGEGMVLVSFSPAGGMTK